MKKIYFLGSCSTNKKILKNLNLDEIELHDIKNTPISLSEIEEMAAMSGSYESLFSRKAVKYRSMGLSALKLKEKDFKYHILKEYTFLKRPVAIIENEIFIGNSKKTIEKLKIKLDEFQNSIR